MHEGRGNFRGGELEDKAGAPISDTLRLASQNSGRGELFTENGRTPHVWDAMAETVGGSTPNIAPFFCTTWLKYIPPLEKTANGAYIC